MRRRTRSRLWTAALLAAPLAFVAIGLLYPIAVFLYRSIDNSEIARSIPRTAAALADWDGRGLPEEPAFAALVADLAEARAGGRDALLARYLNYRQAGIRSAIMKTAAAAGELLAAGGPFRDRLIALDGRWGEPERWQIVARSRGWTTDFYVLTAFDLMRDADGAIVARGDDEAIYVGVLWLTLWISGCVTALCLIVGYPIAYLVASSPPRVATKLMLLVLLPFWSSLLIRSTAWVILLQEKGPLNDLLRLIGAITEPLRIAYTRSGVFIAMTDILLPFMILPIYSTMKGIAPNYVRAAISLGANPLQAFWKVYLPLSLPGVAAGCLLVFVLALGYYITPDLIGGRDDQMLSWFVAQFTNKVVNWGLAAALGAILFVLTTIIFLAFAWRVGISRIRLE